MKKYNYSDLTKRPKDQPLPADVNESIYQLCERFRSSRVNRGLKEIEQNKLYGSFRIVDESGIIVAECKSYSNGVIPNIRIVRNPDTLPFLRKNYYFVNEISEQNTKVGFQKCEN